MKKQIDLNDKRFTTQVFDRDVPYGEIVTYLKPNPNVLRADRIKSSHDIYTNVCNSGVYDDIMHDHEQFVVIFLNKSNTLIHYNIHSKGGISGTVVDVKLILRHAVLLSASALILVHNHPSGNLTPSDADITVTRKLRDAAKLFEIALLDHVIIGSLHGGVGYYSFADNGQI